MTTYNKAVILLYMTTATVLWAFVSTVINPYIALSIYGAAIGAYLIHVNRNNNNINNIQEDIEHSLNVIDKSLTFQIKCPCGKGGIQEIPRDVGTFDLYCNECKNDFSATVSIETTV